ncbi:DUF1285 domain-containing protein [Henriciella aquimarina]|uniref:DUF1285 domain-containing protein n=1 Tax=Henriciella aquimarina TaxID=545261 RepID=UPI001F369BDD|nr:DUF1285 domain-containing protein [Henriciella aquimarina]
MNSKQNTAISLEELLKVIAPDPDGRKLPPVEQWSPERSVDIDMEIRADGSWWHEGGRINREKLVKLFSTILRKDADGSVWLVTPYEKVVVHVEDAPFMAIRVDRAGEAGADQTLAFKTNVGDVVLAGPDNPIRVETDPETLEPSPYVLVRGRLEARLSRPVFYELAEMAEPHPDDENTLGVWSKGTFFSIGPAL